MESQRKPRSAKSNISLGTRRTTLAQATYSSLALQGSSISPTSPKFFSIILGKSALIMNFGTKYIYRGVDYVRKVS